jgi:microcystin-dependent protein
MPRSQGLEKRMSEPYLAEIRMVGFTFAPKGWAMANGQTLPINQNQAVFALLGTNFGGNGQTTFALPDLRGRLPMHMGQGSGLSPHDIGTNGGVEFVTRQTIQIPGSPVSPVSAPVGLKRQVPTLSPFSVVNFVIALLGIFPSRN